MKKMSELEGGRVGWMGQKQDFACGRPGFEYVKSNSILVCSIIEENRLTKVVLNNTYMAHSLTRR